MSGGLGLAQWVKQEVHWTALQLACRPSGQSDWHAQTDARSGSLRTYGTRTVVQNAASAPRLGGLLDGPKDLVKCFDPRDAEGSGEVAGRALASQFRRKSAGIVIRENTKLLNGDEKPAKLHAA